MTKTVPEISSKFSSYSFKLLVAGILLLIIATDASAQRKKGRELVDSLIAQLPLLHEDANKLKLYIDIADASFTFDPNTTIKYGNKGIELATQLKSEKDKAFLYSYMGTASWYRSDYANALDYLFKCLKITEAYSLDFQRASAYGNIALVYTSQNDLSKALEYSIKSLQIYETRRDSADIGRLLGNIGNIYKKQGDYDKAIEYYQKALIIDEQNGLKSYLATVIVNLADVNTLRRDYAKALPYYFKALRMHESIGSRRGIAVATANIGSTYLMMLRDSTVKIVPDSLISSIPDVNIDRAIANLKRSLEFARQVNFAEALVDIHHTLAEAYVMKGRYNEAYENYQVYEKMKDSVFSKEKAEAISRLETERAVLLKDKQIEIDQLAIANKSKQIEIGKLALEQKNKLIEIDRLALTNKDKQIVINQLGIANKDKQIELDKLAVANKQKQIELNKLTVAKQENERIFFIGGILLLIGIIIYIFRSNKLLGSEKQKSENLLLNILPSEVADELKMKGTAEAKYFDNVTILFTDFVNFTGAGERMSSSELIGELDTCFKAFDDIVSKYNIEKIKTIGDAYLAVCGLPLPDGKHAENVIKAALEIQKFMLERRARLHDQTFEIRIGAHSGPVVAGIVGVKKFAFDIWGDTVNTAARMEQNSEPGKINISHTTYLLVADKFRCIYRGEIDAKNKGKLQMYFAEGAQ